MGLFNIFTQKDSDDTIKDYLQKGAIVLDVRTQEEWDDQHLEQAKHIVLNTIPENIEEIKSWGKPVITVCKSGGRSDQAAKYLNHQGLDAINGGPWQNVAQFLS